jgi:hypothetical protein
MNPQLISLGKPAQACARLAERMCSPHFLNRRGKFISFE